MDSLFFIVIVVSILNYILIGGSINFINFVNHENIHDRKIIRVLISVLSSVSIWLLYAKYSLDVFFIRYAVMIVFLTLIGYLDWYTHNIYNFIVYIFLLIGIVFQIIDIFYYCGDIYSLLVGALGSLAISFILAFIKQIGWGDVEIFFIISLYITGFLSIFNVFLSLILSGCYSIPKVFLKKFNVSLNDESALGPFIAISSFFILIMYF